MAAGVNGDERVFDDEKQRAWVEGCRREEAIRSLLERHGDQRLSIADVDEVAWELGVTRERVRQIQMDGLKRLKEILESSGYSFETIFN